MKKILFWICFAVIYQRIHSYIHKWWFRISLVSTMFHFSLLVLQILFDIDKIIFYFFQRFCLTYVHVHVFAFKEIIWDILHDYEVLRKPYIFVNLSLIFSSKRRKILSYNGKYRNVKKRREVKKNWAKQ